MPQPGEWVCMITRPEWQALIGRELPEAITTVVRAHDTHEVVAVPVERQRDLLAFLRVITPPSQLRYLGTSASGTYLIADRNESPLLAPGPAAPVAVAPTPTVAIPAPEEAPAQVVQAGVHDGDRLPSPYNEGARITYYEALSLQNTISTVLTNFNASTQKRIHLMTRPYRGFTREKRNGVVLQFGATYEGTHPWLVSSTGWSIYGSSNPDAQPVPGYDDGRRATHAIKRGVIHFFLPWRNDVFFSRFVSQALLDYAANFETGCLATLQEAHTTLFNPPMPSIEAAERRLIDNISADTRSAHQKLVEAQSILNDRQRKVNEFVQLRQQQVVNPTQILEQIRTLPEVRDAIVLQQQLHVLTQEIPIIYDGRMYHMGAYEIMLNLRDFTLKVSSVDRPRSAGSHPHISDYRLCFGNMRRRAEEFTTRRNAYALVQTALLILGNYNPGDAYRSMGNISGLTSSEIANPVARTPVPEDDDDFDEDENDDFEEEDDDNDN